MIAQLPWPPAPVKPLEKQNLNQTKHPQSSLSQGDKGSGSMKFSIAMKLLGAVLGCNSPPRLLL